MSRDLSGVLPEVARTLSAASQLELALDRVLWAGYDSLGLRPQVLEPGRGFVIALSRSVHAVEAFLVTDTFSGDLVRTLGESLALRPEEWLALERESAEDGISVSVLVNDEYQPDLASLPDDTWRTLEIECRRRVGRAEDFEPPLLAVARACLSFVLAGLDVVVEVEGEHLLPEGARTQVTVNKYERDPVNRMRCIDAYGSTCWVCDFDFAAVYGQLGSGYVVVHHVVPVSAMGPGYLVDPMNDLVPLCPNCHAMVHTQDPPIHPTALRRGLGKPAKPFGRPAHVAIGKAVAGRLEGHSV